MATRTLWYRVLTSALVQGANIAGFERVAEAMMAQGLV